MFDLNRWPIAQRIGRRFRSNLYILVYDTNRRPIINMIGVAVNRLVGMGLYHCIEYIFKCTLCPNYDVKKTNIRPNLNTMILYIHVYNYLIVQVYFVLLIL